MIEIMVVVVIVAILAVIALPTYLNYVKSSYASEARTVMSNINNASKMYYQTSGQWPSEVDELERAGQLDLSRSTKLKLGFDIQLNDQGGRITATSTEEMSGGAGHQVIYDADNGKFIGYGSPEGE
jgi:type II secretory pathway pseudopilin PulG